MCESKGETLVEVLEIAGVGWWGNQNAAGGEEGESAVQDLRGVQAALHMAQGVGAVLGRREDVQ